MSNRLYRAFPPGDGGCPAAVVKTPARKAKRSGMLYRLLFWLLLPLFLAVPQVPPLFALDADTGLDKYIIHSWTTKNGLPQDTVYAVVQDSSGYIWIGTDDGLVRFDGVRFEVFRTQDTRELLHNSITALCPAADGTLWVGTFGGGLTVYKDGVFRHFNGDDGLPNDFIWVIMEDSQQDTWIGTTGGGLICIPYSSRPALLAGGTSQTGKKDQPGWIKQAAGAGSGLKKQPAAGDKQQIHFITYTTRDGLANNIIKALYEDRQGRLWVGTEDGLTVIKDIYSSSVSKTSAGNPAKPEFITYRVEDGIAYNVIMSIFEDSSKNTWIGTANGLTRFTAGKFYTYRQSSGLSNNVIHAICEDRDKNLWLATEKGLNRLREETFDSLTLVEGLSDNSLLTLLEDREGNLWIGTSGKGVNVLHDTKFTFYDVQGGLSENSIRAVYQDPQGIIWAGTNGGGLNRINNAKVTIYTTKNGLNSNFINSAWGNGSRQVWVGTNSGLNLFENGVFTRLLPEGGNRPTATGPSIISIYGDIEKNFWFGTYGRGLFLYKEGHFFHIGAGARLGNNFVLSIAEDKSGHIWVGTNNGLTVIDKGDGSVEDIFAEENYRTYTEADGLVNDTVYDIYIDNENIIWLGTNGGGLVRFEKGKFTAYRTDSGLFSDVVYRIMEDASGKFWMSSNKGIFTVAKRDLYLYSKGEIYPIPCLSFQEDDGLISSVCSGGFQPAGWKGRDGRLYFPTNRGIAAINPAEVKYNTVKPPVLIEQVVVDGKEIDFKRQSKLPSGTDRIRIRFNALSFTAPKKVHFRYRLTGSERNWQETQSREPVEYPGLTPGDYKFQVIAGNNDNTWNFKGATYSFTIKRPLHMQYGFQLLLLFVVSLAAFLFYQFYRQRVKEGKYRASTLENWQSRRYLEKLLDIMEKEKPYRDPEITVEKLGKMMGISEKHLSQVLNERLQENFNQFINKYRIEEAKRMILDPKQKDFVLLKIAYEVGFNSKSAFNAAFKKFTGMSPTEYRKTGSI